jgi:hypothetical protein
VIAFGLILGVTFFCSPTEPGAHYDASRNAAIFAPAYCAVWKHDPRQAGFESIAIFVAAHEVGHSRDPDIATRIDCGRRGPCESFADCWAAGHFVAVGRALGYPLRKVRAWRLEARRTVGHGSYGPIPRSCWR